MSKVDVKREMPTYAARRGRFDVVELPPQRYLMVDGSGDPNTSAAYADALATLYPVAYALKGVSRSRWERDFVVPPLEALWWADDMAAFTAARDKTLWYWTAMLLVPTWLTDADIDQARSRASAAPALDRLRTDVLDEGLAVQTLHVGSYDDEAPVLAHLHDEVIPSLGLRMAGRHHEVYLSDARRTAPERLRTILRQPVVRG